MFKGQGLRLPLCACRFCPVGRSLLPASVGLIAVDGRATSPLRIPGGGLCLLILLLETCTCAYVLRQTQAQDQGSRDCL